MLGIGRRPAMVAPDSERVAVAADGRAVGDEGAGHFDERLVVLCAPFPANPKRSIVVVPTIRPLDDPAARSAPDTAQKW